MKSGTHFLTAITVLCVSARVAAHEGHGLAGTHWHASDAYGFMLVAALSAVALWLSRGE